MVRLVVHNRYLRTTSQQRRSLLASIHIAKKKLGLEDDDYRALLKRVAGQTSAKDCSNSQLGQVMSEFKRLGFKVPEYRTHKGRATSPIAKKARALWIGLYALGVIDNGSERSLEAFGKRQLGIDRLHWAEQSHSSPLIEALKAWAEREGWKQKLPARLKTSERVRILTERLVLLQVKRLTDLRGNAPQIDVAGMSIDDLHETIRSLGAQLREAKE